MKNTPSFLMAFILIIFGINDLNAQSQKKSKEFPGSNFCMSVEVSANGQLSGSGKLPYSESGWVIQIDFTGNVVWYTDESLNNQIVFDVKDNTQEITFIDCYNDTTVTYAQRRKFFQVDPSNRKKTKFYFISTTGKKETAYIYCYKKQDIDSFFPGLYK